MDDLKLNSRRLLLRPVTMEDLDILHRIWTLPEVRQYLWDNKIIEKNLVSTLIQTSKQLFAKEKRGLWLIREKKNLEIIGFAGLWDFFEEQQPQIIYGLVPEKFNQGYAFEAGKSVIDYAHKQLGYSYIIGSCDAPHKASKRVMLKLGMEEIEQRIIEGKPTVFYKKRLD